MSEEIVSLQQDHSNSPLYSEDLAPVPKHRRTWSKWHLAALWVGMAVCIPTYLLASYMIGGGMTWVESLVIIGLANIIITIPMVLNGHAGVKYGIPFPVIGRSSFGIRGIHIPAVVRALVACGWFGIQTWIGGLAIYAIFNAATGSIGNNGLCLGKFISFGIFWLINMYFIWKGTESIKFLEQYAAPILILIGVILIGWGAKQAGGFGIVLEQSEQLKNPVAQRPAEDKIILNPLVDKNGKIKADEYRLIVDDETRAWIPLENSEIRSVDIATKDTKVQFRKRDKDREIISSEYLVTPDRLKERPPSKLWQYILWLTIMLGFWATMSLSIADITRYAASQKDQVVGQFIGLPGTMMLYSFVGIFVTCAAVINFDDILIASDAPWDPVSLLAKFKSPTVVIISQVFMIIATLSTNIAANVIAPANAFSNLSPKHINFQKGGLITAIIGVIICPWILMDQIQWILIFVSGLLGPVLGIMLADYFVIRKKRIDLDEIYEVNGKYQYSNGFNPSAMVALFVGVFVAVIGFFVKSLEPLYNLSWFTGFIVSFVLYYLLMKKNQHVTVS